ncbi:type II secretion system protein GspL [Pseudomonas cerasi]
MPRPLVLHCQKDPHQLRWYCQNGDGTFDSGELDSLLPPVKFSSVILLVPASQVLFTQVPSEHVHCQTLSWHFEDIALSEPEALHAVVLSKEKEQIYLAAMDKHWLQSALDSVKTLGVEVTQVLPDVMAVNPGMRMYLEPHWLIRHSEWCGFSATQDELHALKPLEPTLEKIPCCPQQGIEKLMQLAMQSPVNFLQGAFARKLSLRTPRRLLITGLLCCILSLLMPPLIAGWQAQRAISALQRQAQNLYTTYFPQQKTIDPGRQFAKNYHALLSAPRPDSMLLLLADSAAVLATLEDNPPQSLIWNESQQQLRLSFSQDIVIDPQKAQGLRFVVEGRDMLISREITKK